jgi:hypothetical protein
MSTEQSSRTEELTDWQDTSTMDDDQLQDTTVDDSGCDGRAWSMLSETLTGRTVRATLRSAQLSAILARENQS